MLAPKDAANRGICDLASVTLIEQNASPTGLLKDLALTKHDRKWSFAPHPYGSLPALGWLRRLKDLTTFGGITSYATAII